MQFFLPQVLIDFEQYIMLTVYFSNLLNEFYSANKINSNKIRMRLSKGIHCQ